MKLIACESSAVVREAFSDAVSCDLQPTEIPGNHYQCDVLKILSDQWDMLIAFPPCTYLCNSGVRWLYNSDKTINKKRWALMIEAAEFFNTLLNAPIGKIAIENPIMHKHAKQLLCQDYTQIIQPWQFGHGETKATCLWLKGLPMLQPTQIVTGRLHKIHEMTPGKNRSKNRSRTYPGIAKAMAEQWN